MQAWNFPFNDERSPGSLKPPGVSISLGSAWALTSAGTIG